MKTSILLMLSLFTFSQVNAEAIKEISKKTEQINKIIDLNLNEEIIKQIFHQLVDNAEDQFKKIIQPLWQQIPEASIRVIKPKIENLFVNFKKMIEHNVSVKEVQSRVFDFYNNEFTEEEIEELLSFYQTPVSKKLNSKSSILEKNINNYYESIIEKHRPQLHQDMMKIFSN